MNNQLIVAAILMLINIFIAIGTYFRYWSLHIPMGFFSLQHWLAIIGGTYLLVFVTWFAYKRRYSSLNRNTLMKVHVFGNLAAFTIITAHFAQQMGRPAEFAADLGTGLSSYFMMVAIVATGIMMRFWPSGKTHASRRLIHIGFSLSILIVFLIHALKNFGFF